MRILTTTERESSVKIRRKLINLFTSGNKLLINLLLKFQASCINREHLTNLLLQNLTSGCIVSEETSSTLALKSGLGPPESGISNILNITSEISTLVDVAMT